MKSLNFVLGLSIVVANALYADLSYTCVDDNRTEQGTVNIIDGNCSDPVPLPYPDRYDCGEGLKSIQGSDTSCINGILAPDPGPYPPLLTCPIGKIIDQGTGKCTINAPSTTDPLPANITIDNAALEKIIVSTYDDTPYDPAIDIQGYIDTNVTVSVPYTVVNSGVRLPARSISVVLDPSVTQDGESGIIATFSWLEQTSLPVGSGTFTAILSIDDSAGDGDSIYNAKKLDLDDNSEGLIAATLLYATDSAGTEGNLTLKIHPGILDRMFRLPDNDDDNSTHELIYFPITNSITGETWLGNNLGANYANMNNLVFNPSKQAEDPYDYNAYGSSFQWGRKADSHELMAWTSGTAGSGINGITTVLSDEPTVSQFIIGAEPYRDWRENSNDNLWQSEAGSNNVCPLGYRIPTRGELYLEAQSWATQNRAGAHSSLLVMPMQGPRRYFSGNYQSGYGTYWTSNPWSWNDPVSAFQLWIQPDDIDFQARNRAAASPVRCIKD